MDLEQATIIFLILVFVAAELYRCIRGRRGVIVSFHDLGPFSAILPVLAVSVRLQDGQEVTAQLNGCTACLGRLKVGDEIRISNSSDGYVVDLPWFRTSGTVHRRLSRLKPGERIRKSMRCGC